MNRHPKYTHLEVHQFKKGQSGNLQGRPKGYQTILKELGYTKPVIATMVAEIMFLNENEVWAIAKSETEPVIRKLIARAFYNAGHSGEYKDIEDFMTILFGRSVPFIPEPEKKQADNV